MWKKDEAQPLQTTTERPRPRTPVASGPAGGRATIGPSISIRGDVTGSEDLLIQGQVDGSVTLDLHAVSVGSDGRVNANITGRVITIEGAVEGDLTAEEQIVLLGSARVQGDIKAPRVVLEDGATFRGLVDMGSSPKSATRNEGRASVGTTEDAESPPQVTREGAKGRSTGSADGSASKTGNGATDQRPAAPQSATKGSAGKGDASSTRSKKGARPVDSAAG